MPTMMRYTKQSFQYDSTILKKCTTILWIDVLRIDDLPDDIEIEPFLDHALHHEIGLAPKELVTQKTA